MISNKLIKLVISATVLLQAVIFQIALPNMVLCIGDDGHIAFEWQVKDTQCISQSKFPAFILTQAEQNTNDASGPNCLDVDLHIHFSTADKFKVKTNSLLAVNKIQPICANFTGVYRISQKLFSETIPPVHPVSNTLHSTVLII